MNLIFQIKCVPNFQISLTRIFSIGKVLKHYATKHQFFKFEK